jgi:hypothetical protein
MRDVRGLFGPAHTHRAGRGSPFGPLTDSKSEHLADAARLPAPGECADLQLVPGRETSHALLAMQKVEGSNPLSRFREGLHLQVFFVRPAGWCVCVAGYPLGTRGAAAARVLRKHLVAGTCRRLEPLTFFRAAARSGSDFSVARQRVAGEGATATGVAVEAGCTRFSRNACQWTGAKMSAKPKAPARRAGSVGVQLGSTDRKDSGSASMMPTNTSPTIRPPT